jgi:hypothetical protein
MFYGANFGVGAYIYKSVIPVTLGNIIGGAVFLGCAFWFLYGRDDTVDARSGQAHSGQKREAPTGIPGNSGVLNAVLSRLSILNWNGRRHGDASERV